MEKYIEYLVEWIKREVNNAGAKGVIVGISGGIDSAVVASLAKKAFPEKSLGIILPIYEMGNDLKDAKQLIENIKINYLELDLSMTYLSLVNILPIESKLSLGNLKARLRMSTLYALAQENNYLVLGTDNACEYYLGYFTKYGDGGVDLLPIVHLNKAEVSKAAKILNVPNEIIIKKPSAGLWENQTDEQELGFSYKFINDYLNGIEVPLEIKQKIELLHKNSEHKRIPIKKPEEKYNK